MPIDIKEEFRKEDEEITKRDAEIKKQADTLAASRLHQTPDMANVKSTLDLTLKRGIFGDEIKKKIDSPEIGREVFIEDILSAEGVLMMCADEGAGKSTLSIQMALSLANGIPCYGRFNIPKPRHVFYIMCERSIMEPLERLAEMESVLNVSYNNLYITTGLQPLDFSQPKAHGAIISYMTDELMRLGWPSIDVVFIDPLYQAVKRGLSNEEAASYFVAMATLIQNVFGCCVVLVHHTNRGGRDESGKRGNRDMYGSGFISNCVTGAYHIKKTQHGTGWEKIKDNHSILIDKFSLIYDSDSYLSNIDTSSINDSKKGIILEHIRTYAQTAKEFTVEELAKVSSSTLKVTRRVLRGTTKFNIIDIRKLKDNSIIHRAELKI